MENEQAMNLDQPIPDPPEYAESISMVRQAIDRMSEGMKKVDAQIRFEVALANLRSNDEIYRNRGSEVLIDIIDRISTKTRASSRQPVLEQKKNSSL